MLDRFPQRDFGLWVSMCPINIIPFCRLSILRLPRQGLRRPIYTARATTPLPPLHSYQDCVYIPATTPRATTPHLYCTGYHAFTTTAQRSRLCIYHGYHAEGYHAPSLTTGYHACVDYTSRLHPGYNTRAITLHHTRTSGYHTRHSSSYFVVYVSPAIRPPANLTYTTTGAPHATTYSTFPFSPLSTYLGCIAICQRCACLRH